MCKRYSLLFYQNLKKIKNDLYINKWMNERMKLVNKNIFFDGFTEHLKLAYGLKIRQMA